MHDGPHFRRDDALLRSDTDVRDPIEPAPAAIADAAAADVGATIPARAAAAARDAGLAADDEAPPIEHRPNAGPFHDIPASIWTVFMAGWTGFFLLMLLFFAVDRESSFMVAVAILFAVMAFGVPIVMGKQDGRAMAKHIRTTASPPYGVVHTHTGAVSVRAAAVQIALIPVAVFFGFLCFILFVK